MAFFEIYKSGQGKFVRWGTVAGIAIITLAGMAWIGLSVIPTAPTAVKITAVLAFAAVGALLAFLAVSRPRPAEFMIMTESEMRKVNWPSRQVVFNSTKVVITLTLLLGIMLAVVDFGFIKLFSWLHVLSSNSVG